MEDIKNICLVTRNSQWSDKFRSTLFELLNNADIAYALIVTNPINDEDEDRWYRRLWIVHQSKTKRLQLLWFGDNIYYTLNILSEMEQPRYLTEEQASLQNTDIFLEDDKVTSDNCFYYDGTHQELINSLLLAFPSK